MTPSCKLPIGMSKSTTTLSSKVFTEYLLNTQKIDYICHLQTNNYYFLDLFLKERLNRQTAFTKRAEANKSRL